MRKILPILVLFVAILSTVPSAAAYGGGNGFPPGYYGNPRHTNKLVCTIIKKQLPFNREISVPNCKVVRGEVTRAKNHNIQERLNDFLTRVIKGGK